MKLSSSIVAVVFMQSLFSQMAVAQNSPDLMSDVDSEIEQIYSAQAARKKSSSQVTSSAQPSNASVVTTQTIVVPQQSVQQSAPAPVQKQPEVVIEAAPLATSKAEEIRKGRQEAELKTETIIVEKLEQSRLEDEKKRAAVLFGDKFNQLDESQKGQSQSLPMQQPTAQTVQILPVVIAASATPTVKQEEPKVAPAQPIIIQQNETLTRDAVREEVRAALSEDEMAVTPSLQQKYFSAAAGIGQYPDIESISGNYSLGAAFGTRFDYFLVEGAFTYSNYTVSGLYESQSMYGYGSTVQLGSFDMNQYQGSIATKYQLLGGFVRPVVGGLVSYSYRKYTTNSTAITGRIGDDFGSSHAIDLGLITGVDLEINEKTSFGVDFRYMFNMANKLNGRTAAGATPVEKLQYFTTGIFARVNF